MGIEQAVRHPSGEQLPRRPAHRHAYNVADPAEDPAMIVHVAAEVHDTQTAKGASRCHNTVADGVGDAYATNAAGTTVLVASKSL